MQERVGQGQSKSTSVSREGRHVWCKAGSECGGEKMREFPFDGCFCFSEV